MKTTRPPKADDYDRLLGDISQVFTAARSASVRTVNAIMTAAYWVTGLRVVEYEQGGARRAEYGVQLLQRLTVDLTSRHGRGFGVDNLQRMRAFYLSCPPSKIYATLSRKFTDTAPALEPKHATPSRKSGRFPATTSELAIQIRSTPSGTSSPIAEEEKQAALLRKSGIHQRSSGLFTLSDLAAAFPLSWSHYVLLLKARSPEARAFYEEEALRGGWPVRTLDRQMSTLFYERTALSRDKAAMLRKHAQARPGEQLTPAEAIKDPLILEFLDLKDEYSETDLEDELIDHLQQFLLELGDDFAFVARQRRLRLDNEWYRVDLVFFHRRLRCLVVIDLKVGKFTHADAGQMHLYLNYAREHWVKPGENPPVGLILCSSKGDDVAKYALENLPNKVLAAEYRLALPPEERLLEELRQTRRAWELRRLARASGTGSKP